MMKPQRNNKRGLIKIANKKVITNSVPIIDTIINKDSITYMVPLPDNCVELYHCRSAGHIEIPECGSNYKADTRKGVAVEYITKSA